MVPGLVCGFDGDRTFHGRSSGVASPCTLFFPQTSLFFFFILACRQTVSMDCFDG